MVVRWRFRHRDCGAVGRHAAALRTRHEIGRGELELIRTQEL